MEYFTNLLKELKDGKLYPVYLFYGPETYLRKEAIRRIQEFLHPLDDFNFTEVDGERTSSHEIVSLARTMPFLFSKRLVVVKNIKSFDTNKTSQVSEDEPKKIKAEEMPLINYLESPNPSACVIFQAGEHVDKRKKIYKSILGTGKAIEFSLLKNHHLCSWIEKKAREAGKIINPTVASEILLRTGNKLQALSLEIEKIISYTGDSNVILMEDVAVVTPMPIEDNIFAVVDAIGSKKPAQALAGIESLIKQKHQPPVIMSMIARQIRLILKAGDALCSGTKVHDLAALLGVHPYVAKKVAHQQKNFNRQLLINSIHSLHALDVSVKSGEKDFLPGIKSFILDICR